MAKYRKKPVVIDAEQWNPDKMLIQDILDELKIDSMEEAGVSWCAKHKECLLIKTLEGVMTVNPGDYILKGIQGEIYPCKPDIFKATYEPVDDNTGNVFADISGDF